MKSIITTIRVDPADMQTIKAIALQEDRAISAVIRRLIQLALKSYR